MRLFVVGSFVQACCWKLARLPKPGETLAASSLSQEPGGKGLNVAVGARRLGAEVDVLLGIGRDAAGDGLLRLLAREGLSSHYVWRLAEQSGYGAGLVAADGENLIAVYPGPNQMLTAEHVHTAATAIAKANMVYGQLETAMPAVLAAFTLARLNGVRTILNPSPWQAPPKSLLDVTDVLIVNRREAELLLSLSLPTFCSLSEYCHELQLALVSFWSSWPGFLVVVTLGAAGSLAFARDGTVHQAPAFAVEAVDSVGAGDAFASGFCVELAKPSPVPEALRCGNACGAIVASRFGVLQALPDQTRLHAFYSSLSL